MPEFNPPGAYQTQMAQAQAQTQRQAREAAAAQAAEKRQRVPSAPSEPPSPRAPSAPIVPAERPSNKEITAAIEEFADAVADATYVPSPESFKRMQEIATCVVAVPTPTGDDLSFLLDDDTPLDSKTADVFIRHVRSRQWLLTDFQEEVCEELLGTESFESILASLYFQKPTDNLHSIGTFAEALKEVGSFPTGGLEGRKWPKVINPDVELGRLFKSYISKRIELSLSIKDRTWDRVHLREDKNSDSPAVNAQIEHDREMYRRDLATRVRLQEEKNRARTNILRRLLRRR